MTSEANELLDLEGPIKEHFTACQDRLAAFYKYGVQVEGWFKGELLTCLDRFHSSELIGGFDREVKISTNKIDFTIDIKGERNWIELKQWLIGIQQGYRYGPEFYFSDPTSVGITKDVNKLLNLDTNGRLWLWLLLARNPGSQSWKSGLEKFNAKFAPSHLISKTNPEDYPATFFIGMLEVVRLKS